MPSKSWLPNVWQKDEWKTKKKERKRRANIKMALKKEDKSKYKMYRKPISNDDCHMLCS